MFRHNNGQLTRSMKAKPELDLVSLSISLREFAPIFPFSANHQHQVEIFTFSFFFGRAVLFFAIIIKEQHEHTQRLKDGFQFPLCSKISRTMTSFHSSRARVFFLICFYLFFWLLGWIKRSEKKRKDGQGDGNVPLDDECTGWGCDDWAERVSGWILGPAHNFICIIQPNTRWNHIWVRRYFLFGTLSRCLLAREPFRASKMDFFALFK